MRHALLTLALLTPRLFAQEGAPTPVPAAAPTPDPAANDAKALATLKQLVEAQAAWGKDHAGKRASLLDLILARKLTSELRNGEMAGYRFRLALGEGQRTFSATATPLEYGHSGLRSFFADRKGVRADDLAGQPASSKAPLVEPAAER